MKKLAFGFALAAMSSVALAQTTICLATGAPAANVDGAPDGNTFVRATFAPTCGANTVMVYQQDTGKLWAASASSKGQSFFGASTNGGSVGNIGPCNAGKTCGVPATVASNLAGNAALGKAATLGNTN